MRLIDLIKHSRKKFPYRCFYCGVHLSKTSTPNAAGLVGRTLDHVIPSCKGGPDIKENKVFSCHKCNSLKANKSIHNFCPRPFACLWSPWGKITITDNDVKGLIQDLQDLSSKSLMRADTHAHNIDVSKESP